MSDILKKIKSEAGKVAKGADKAVDIKRIEMQIGSFKKKVEEEYQKIGQMTYETTVLNNPENPELAEVLAKITELLTQIEEKEEEIKVIKDDTTAAAAAPAGKTFCSNCGAENDAHSKFCSSCGTKMG
jgi:regulator of replication initiation timing